MEIKDDRPRYCLRKYFALTFNGDEDKIEDNVMQGLRKDINKKDNQGHGYKGKA